MAALQRHSAHDDEIALETTIRICDAEELAGFFHKLGFQGPEDTITIPLVQPVDYAAMTHIPGTSRQLHSAHDDEFALETTFRICNAEELAGFFHKLGFQGPEDTMTIPLVQPVNYAAMTHIPGTSRQALPMSGKRTINSWLKGEHLGSGSYGSVYEAITDDGFFFAVKEVSLIDQGPKANESIQQLEQEISLLSRLEHENIVQYFGTDKKDGKLYIFLELVTQGSLAALYKRYHLQDSQVSAYTRQILNGLHYLHQRKVLHRDIKCANILVDASGQVKLADFGVAKEISNLSRAKSCKGTIKWMAPEVASAESHEGAADIWSIGCTVLEMLTRKVPYPDIENADVWYILGSGTPPEIPITLSADAHDFIKKCVQVDPKDRPSVAQLLEHPFVRRTA